MSLRYGVGGGELNKNTFIFTLPALSNGFAYLNILNQSINNMAILV